MTCTSLLFLTPDAGIIGGCCLHTSLPFIDFRHCTARGFQKPFSSACDKASQKKAPAYLWLALPMVPGSEWEESKTISFYLELPQVLVLPGWKHFARLKSAIKMCPLFTRTSTCAVGGRGRSFRSGRCRMHSHTWECGTCLADSKRQPAGGSHPTSCCCKGCFCG